jgi:VanZ family protein
MSSKTVSKLSFADFVGIDKLGHLGFYAILTFLWYMALRKKKMHKNVVFVLFILLGALMEFLQTQLALGRIFEWNDLLANIIGAIIGRNLYLRNFKVTI